MDFVLKIFFLFVFFEFAWGSVSAASELSVDHAHAQKNLCDELQKIYDHHQWGKSECESIPFEIFGESVQGRPLLSIEFSGSDPKSLTLVQCGIHGDELPGVPMCLKLISEIRSGKRKLRPATRLIIQPLLNPDGMLGMKNPQRNNANGVDLNRNFPTKDFKEKSMSSWKTKDHSDPRKYPGKIGGSEPEVKALVAFIEKVKPQKIISIHTPLGFLDLDAKGPTKDLNRRAKYLAVSMSKNAGNYRFKSFGFYPGSLGNYAGQERAVPVYTIELPSNESDKPTVDHYWTRFRVALWRAIDFDLSTGKFSGPEVGNED